MLVELSAVSWSRPCRCALDTAHQQRGHQTARRETAGGAAFLCEVVGGGGRGIKRDGDGENMQGAWKGKVYAKEQGKAVARRGVAWRGA